MRDLLKRIGRDPKKEAAAKAAGATASEPKSKNKYKHKDDAKKDREQAAALWSKKQPKGAQAGSLWAPVEATDDEEEDASDGSGSESDPEEEQVRLLYI